MKGRIVYFKKQYHTDLRDQHTLRWLSLGHSRRSVFYTEMFQQDQERQGSEDSGNEHGNAGLGAESYRGAVATRHGSPRASVHSPRLRRYPHRRSAAHRGPSTSSETPHRVQAARA